MKIGSTSLLKLIKKEIIQEKFIIRQFCLTDTRETLSKIIYHYEYLLPISTNDEYEYGQCIPTILTHHFFEFIGYINKRLENRYITIHCGYKKKKIFLIILSRKLILEMVVHLVQYFV
jgi:hypothetical protein